MLAKVLGGFFFSSETVSYRLMGPIEQLPWFHRSVLKGTEKRARKNVQLVLKHCCKTC